ncbi:MAG: AraC family transcriptional regulator ligand-binding domain-containing protein [Zhongshania sp.]|jgi:AraC-like DNA-binding protein|uniref:AraC family transcriptional regulator n=1 Tax=Zhongshania marina TaxID=2304603 RepID=A0A2S4HIK1_9GAMM|nr:MULTISPECIES: AraC family transcriptional regulator [Spongiibacteraceae]MBU0537283.1 AraC family transcriptional regulator [Gammaproteobacteria bacterium]RNL60065.1 AraC family transcriptional regulator [Zhongshania marina]AKH70211.1 DNA-binding domain-containing protein, AraC-type [Spongiibacter sp. IMCC21906]MBU1831597.1 AraC family transcriptional regulator [Gammaproteobacteria bacterium]MDF1693637.1 AraC family transcriptional regulator ligand-binding domain-containing protein [Zhongsha
MTARVRASCLNNFVSLIEELQGNAEDLCLKAGIDYSQLDQEDYFFPYQSFIDLLELSATSLNLPNIGLQLAMRQDHSILGPVAFLALSAHDVRSALTSVGKFLYHFTPAISLTLRESEDQPSYACLELVNANNSRQAVEHAVACTLHIIHLLTEGKFKARAVHFRHSKIGPEKHYQSAFNCPTVFNQKYDSIELDTDFLDIELSSHNPQLHGLVSSYLSMVEIDSNSTSKPNLSTSKQARHLIQKLLPTGQLSRPVIAENMKLHERALHRKLQSEGYTFEALVDEVRITEAKKLLAHDAIPMSQIAGLLGYNEQSSFNRAFKRWFNMTPKQYLQSKP